MLFQHGQLIITTAADELLNKEDVATGFRRHLDGDWGNLGEEDKQTNEDGVKHGYRIMSVYEDRDGHTFWIITESDRSCTTVLLPSDY